MFETVNALAELVLQRFPIIAGILLQISEASGGRRSHAVNKHQQRPFLCVPRQFLGADIQQIHGLTEAARPAIEAGLAIQPAFDRPHQRFRAEPGHAELGDVGGFSRRPFSQLAPRSFDYWIGELAHRHGVNPRNQIADRVADHPARRRGAIVQRFEVQRTVQFDGGRLHPRQRLAQFPGAGNHRHAVGHFENHHVLVFGWRRVVDGAEPDRARALTHVECVFDLEVSVGQKLGRYGRRRTARRITKYPRQSRIGYGRAFELEQNGIRHC